MSDERVGAQVSGETTSGAPADAAFDAESHRRASLAEWEGAAPGWERRQAQMREFSKPVAEWLLHALALQPGERVLDLAAGIGETGLLAARQVGSEGSVILADQAEAMLAAARRRADELQLGNVETKCLNAEWLDLEVGSLDAILCRWGFMLMADPDAALRECRRVLRPEGRIALAVWGAAEENPWASLPMRALIELGVVAAPSAPQAPGAQQHVPGMFALGADGVLAARLEDAGFLDVRVERLQMTRSHESFEDFWETTLDMSPTVHDLVMGEPEAGIERMRDAVQRTLMPFTAVDGSIALPALALVASASA